MKAYITCPVSHTQKRLELLPMIEKTVQAEGVDTFVFEIGGSPKEIFERDLAQLKSCNILIAEVSERSHGVGIEIGLSYLLGLQRILLVEKGNDITKLAQGIPGTTVLEYINTEDMVRVLQKTLRMLVKKK